MQNQIGARFLSEVQITVRVTERLRMEIEKARIAHGMSVKDVVTAGVEMWLEKNGSREKDRA